MNARTLILGGTGYIGGHIARDLASHGHRVTVQGRFDPRPHYPEWSARMERIVLADIEDQAMFDELACHEYDNVINLVSLGPYQQDPPARAAAVDVLPTWKLLDQLSGRGLRRFVYCSTQTVFAGTWSQQIIETTPPAPISQYGLTHVLTEQIVDYFGCNSPVQTINLRLVSCYGSPIFRRGVWSRYVINQLCCMAHRDRVVQLHSDGSIERDFLHLHDLLRSIRRLLDPSLSPEPLYHIASGTTYSVREAAHRVAKVYRERSARRIPVRFPDGRIDSPGASDEQAPAHGFSTEALRRLGLGATISLDDGIAELFDFLDAEGKASSPAGPAARR